MVRSERLFPHTLAYIFLCFVVLTAPTNANSEIRAQFVRFSIGNTEVTIQNYDDQPEIVTYGVANRKGNDPTCVLRPVRSKEGLGEFFIRSDFELNPDFRLEWIDSIKLKFGDTVTLTAFRGCGRLIELKIFTALRELVFNLDD